MTKLSEMKCIPCSGEVPALESDQKISFKQKIHDDWELTHNQTRLMRVIKTKNWVESMGFAQRIGDMAEEQWHHPDLKVCFGRLEIEIWTHKIDDLVESDFIFAAKVDEILNS